MDPQDAAKKAAAEAACAYVESGMTVGLGTGSTADFAVRHLAARMKAEGLRIRGIPTSLRTERLARELGIPLVTLDEADVIDVTIDGADEVDPKLDLIKGLGGALLREKVVASITKRQVIVADPSKLVARLGQKAPLPVEVLPFGVKVVERRLLASGYQPTLRVKDGKPAVTDNGNLVLDTRFPGGIADARKLEADIDAIPGVVETGFFLGMTWKVVVGEQGGKIREIGR